MGCSTCGSNGLGAINQQRTVVGPGFQFANYSDQCSYTLPQLQIWLTLLVCVKDKFIYQSFGLTAPQLNKYLGIVQSALNYVTYPCMFAKQLDEIMPYVINIQNSAQC